MDFELSPDQEDLAKRVRRFAETAVRPYRHQQDLACHYREGLLEEMAAEGLFGLRIPARYGGSDHDAMSVGIALEELAAADLSVCFPVLNASLVGGVLAANAGPEQLERWLPDLAAGRAITALALTEPEAGTDAAGITMTATRQGDGWVLTGVKTSIMATTYATHALVFARTGAAGARGISAFYLDLAREGVSRSPLSDLGSRAGGRGTIEFASVYAGADELVGGEGLGFVEVMRGFAVSRAMIALMAVAVASSALEEALEYARTRQAFGQALGRHQSVAFPLMEHLTFMHAARLVTLQALWCADTGRDPRIPANMAKWWAPKAAMEAVHQALLTLGQLGWTEDGGVSKSLRDVIGLQLADGTQAATKLVLARTVLGREFAP